MIPTKTAFYQLLILQLSAVTLVIGGEGWKHIPEIPAGRRAQYYLLKKDGGYKYGYDTGDGTSGKQSASSANEVTGNYAYLGSDGQQRGFQYTSGVGGFIPNLSPQNPQPAGPSPALYSPASPPVQTYQQPAPEEESSGDASYNFSFDTGTFQQQESSDSSHNVAGSYKYTAEDGEHSVTYTAGPGIGFIANVAEVQGSKTPIGGQGNYQQTIPPSGPVIGGDDYQQVTQAVLPTQEESSGDASYSFAYDAGDHSRTESSDAKGNVKGSFSFTAKDDGVRRTVDYTAGANTGFIATGAHLPVPPDPLSPQTAPPTYTGPSVNQQPIPPTFPGPQLNQQPVPYSPSESTGGSVSSGLTDGSYSFSYDAGDHSRTESSDNKGNVKGSFSFVAKDDGASRTVDYSAGSETGFIATGAHLPVPVSPLVSPVSPPIGQQPIPYTPVESGEGIGSGVSGGAYSFSYDAGDHSRTESGDASGNVKGSFSFIAKDDGASRTVDYSAGSETGFIATGAHLPVPVIPLVPISPVTPPVGQQPIPYTPVESGEGISSGVSGGSYSFSYDAGDHSRTENGDANGNVKGSFSFIAKDDGASRTVDYTAGANTGFIATGAHLPVPVIPIVPIVPVVPHTYSVPSDNQQTIPYQPSFSSTSGSSFSSGTNIQGFNSVTSGIDINRGSSPISPPTSSSEDEGSGDASYSYSYKTDSSSKQETSDSKGNVQGSFTFLDGGGVSRTLTYTATNDEGFIAKGDHLPKPGIYENPIASDQSNQVSFSKGTSVVQGIKGSSVSTGQNSNFGVKGIKTFNNQIKNTFSKPIKSSDYTIHTYLPPSAVEKYGYIFDTKVN